MNIRSVFAMIGIGVMATSLFSCNGIFDNIYDNGSPLLNQPEETRFVSTPTPRSPGVIFIDASSYEVWNYVNIKKQQIYSYNMVTKEGTIPQEWDFALHHYDFKTNDGAAMVTDYSDMLYLIKNKQIPEGTFTKDGYYENKMVVGTSHMLESGPDYAPSFLNPVLDNWLKVDTSNMPPTYTLSNKVYLLKLKDGKIIALQMPSYMNKTGDKGFVTIKYYPIK